MVGVGIGAVAVYLFGVTIAPEQWQFLTALMVTFNTAITLWHSTRINHKVTRVIQPALETAAEEATKAATIVERRQLDRSDGDADQH